MPQPEPAKPAPEPARPVDAQAAIDAAKAKLESGELHVGDEVIVTGPTTGAVPVKVEEIRVDLKPVEKTVKGEHFSIKVGEKVRPSDKLFVWRKVVPKQSLK